MRILLIGNGFDLYHNLPTRYMSFLEFSNVVLNLCHSEETIVKLGEKLKVGEAVTGEIATRYNLQKVPNESLRTYIKYLQEENPKMKEKLFDFLDDNTWIKYFNKCKKISGQSWVDFESEISRVVQALDKCYKNVGIIQNVEGLDWWYTINLFDTRKKILGKTPIGGLTIEDVLQMRDKAQRDLDRIIGALEIYLNDYVEKMDVYVYIPELVDAKFDKLLSFNYTSTYEKIYGKYNPNIECEHVHGLANANDDKIEMVLGIDDYLIGDEANTDTTFIRFKKYFQMLQKRTAFKYKDWLSQINANKEPSELLVFGHSLNYSDKTLLSNFILNPNVKTKIYYYSEGQYGRILENLIKVIGRDNVIDLVGDSDSSKIRFIKQQEKEYIKIGANK